MQSRIKIKIWLLQERPSYPATKCNLCIYNRNLACILDEIIINYLGMCDDCVIVALDEDFLEVEKNDNTTILTYGKLLHSKGIRCGRMYPAAI